MLGSVISVGEKERRAVALELDARSRHGGCVKDLIIRVSITVLDVVPVIWRRIEVPADVTLEGLHDVIQVVMGWADYHLHHFRIGNLRYSAPTPNDVDMQDGGKLKLSTLVVDGERAFEYFTTTATTGVVWSCSKQSPR